MKALKQVRNVVMMLAMAFVMTLAFSAVVKAAPTAPAKVLGVKQTEDSEKSVKLEWSAQLTNPSYAVELSTDKVTWVEVEDWTSGNYAYVSNLNAGSNYYARVRAYAKEWNTETKEYDCAYGPYSDVIECVTAPNASPKNLKKTACTTTSISLAWDAVAGANYYAVAWGNNFANVVYVPTNKATLTKLPKNSTHTIRVYALRKSAATGYVTEADWSYSETLYGCAVTPGKVTGVAVDNYWSNLGQIDVTCNKLASASNYQAEVWTAYAKKDVKVKSAYNGYSTLISTYLSSAKLKKHNFYKVRMRAYTTLSSGKKVYGAWSGWKYVCQQPDVTAMTPTSKGMNIKYDKIAGADRYAIYMSTKQKSGYKKVATTTKTSYTVRKFNKKKLVKGRTYYVYVVAYNKVGRTYYSGEAGDANSCWYKKY